MEIDVQQEAFVPLREMALVLRRHGREHTTRRQLAYYIEHGVTRASDNRIVKLYARRGPTGRETSLAAFNRFLEALNQ